MLYDCIPTMGLDRGSKKNTPIRRFAGSPRRPIISPGAEERGDGNAQSGVATPHCHLDGGARRTVSRRKNDGPLFVHLRPNHADSKGLPTLSWDSFVWEPSQ